MFEKKQSKGAPDLSNKLFPISEPYGYNPESVNKAVAEMKLTIEKQQDYIQKLKESLIIQKEQNEKLESELRNMQMQMTFAQVPSINDIQEEYIYNKFNKQFNIEKDESEEAIKEGGKDSKDINPETQNKSKADIIKGNKIKIGGNKPKEEPPKTETKKTSGNTTSGEDGTFSLEDFL